MLILFDHGTPLGLARELPQHTVKAARNMGWEALSNGDLLRSAEAAGFDLLLTTDQRIRYQQNLTGRRIAILVFSGTTRWSRVQRRTDEIRHAVNMAAPSSYTEVFIPFRDDKASAIQ